MTVGARLYRMRTGRLWKDLPEMLGDWNRIYKRYNAYSTSGKHLKAFKALMLEPKQAFHKPHLPIACTADY